MNQQPQYTGWNRWLKSAMVERLKQSRKDGTFGTFFADWKWIFGYSRRYRRAVVFYILMGMASSTLSIVSSVAGKYLIDIVLQRNTGRLVFLALLAVAGTLFSLLFNSAVSRLSARISIDVNNDIQADIFARILDADWMQLSAFAGGDLLNRFTNDVNTVASNAVNWLPNVIISVYSFLSTFLVILHYDVTMALLALLSAPFLLLTSRYLMHRLREHRRRVLELNSGMMSFESETFTNFDNIKSFGLADRSCAQMTGWQQRYKQTNLDYNQFSIQSNLWLSALGAAVTFVVFGYCLLRLWSGAITFGTMTLFLQQSSRLRSTFNSLVGIFPGMVNGAVSAHRVREMTELKREIHDPAAAETLRPLARSGLTVELEDVAFAYEPGKTVVHDCNFRAAPNQIVALVGPSGEGKTTILRLLLGLIHPTQGRVTLRAGEVAVPMTADTREFFAYVPQGNSLFSGAVEENLRMMCPDATDAQLEAALRSACAWDFVSRMEHGIHSKVGERGRGLSEGQAQRLALARALLRDAPVLLLDEATSALDPATERRILQNLMRACSGRTCIVTTHRPSVLSLCSRIYRVGEGTVTELTREQAARLMESAGEE